MIQAATAKRDVTPPLHVPYLGSHPRHEFPTGTHDPLYVRALVLQSEDTRIAILSLDAIGLSRRVLGPERDFIKEARQRISKQSGIPVRNILLAATHAHSTPQTLNIKPLWKEPGAVEWLEEWIAQMANCVADACARLRPAQLKAGQSLRDDLTWNRHSEKNAQPRPIDPRLDVLHIEYSDGGAPDALVRFTCHPTIVQLQPLWSADFPGVLCAEVERTTGGNCLFLQGASGDINARGEMSFEQAAYIGRELGIEACRVLTVLKGGPSTLLSELQVAVNTIELSSRALPDVTQCVEEEATAYREFERDGSTPNLIRYRAAYSALDRVRMGDAPLRAEVQALRIGDWALVTIPGELFVEFAFDIQAASPFKHTWVATCCNDYLGYFSRQWAWEEKLYPSQLGPWCLAGPESGSLLVEAALQTLKQTT